MEIQIAVCGAGTMGSGIAQVFAQHGFPVILFDAQPEAIEKAALSIGNSLKYLAAKKKIDTAEVENIKNRIRYTNEISECNAFIIIEAIIENLPVKIELFRQLALTNNEEVIFVSNTSSLSISELQKHINFPERIAGLHFFNPPYAMPLVEIVRGAQTSDETISELQSVCTAIGKKSVVCKDAPGFIVNHVARPYYLESLYLVEKGVATTEEVDKILEATGFRMGAFRLMDLIGIDINLKTSESVYEALGKPERLRPSAIQKKKVAEGLLGRKTGSGFYEY